MLPLLHRTHVNKLIKAKHSHVHLTFVGGNLSIFHNIIHNKSCTNVKISLPYITADQGSHY